MPSPVSFQVNDSHKLIKQIAIIVGSVIALWYGYKFLKKEATFWGANMNEKMRDEYEIAVKAGNKKYKINLLSIADQIYNCFHGRWDEDEDGAIAALKTVPREVIPQLAVVYSSKGYDLRSDFNKYLTKSQYQQVSSLLI